MPLALQVAAGYYLSLLVACIAFLMLGVIMKYWEHLLGLAVALAVAVNVPGAPILFAIVGIVWMVMVDRRERASRAKRYPAAALGRVSSPFPRARETETSPRA
jgi:hypothetical protein